MNQKILRNQINDKLLDNALRELEKDPENKELEEQIIDMIRTNNPRPLNRAERRLVAKKTRSKKNK